MANSKSRNAETQLSRADGSLENSRTKKRLNLDLTPETYELLQQLSEESGKSMAEILRTGLALYGIAQEEKKKGRELAIVDENEEVKKQIILP